jgi:hypothetical protein
MGSDDHLKEECQDEFDLSLHSIMEEIDDDQLAQHMGSVALMVFESFIKTQYQPSQSILKNFYNQMGSFEDLSQTDLVQRTSDLFTHLTEKGEDWSNSVQDLESRIETLPVAMKMNVPEVSVYIQKGDSWSERFSKLRHRPYYWFKSTAQREIPVRSIARSHLLPFSSEFSRQMTSSWYHLLGRLIVTCQRHFEQKEVRVDELRAALKEEAQTWQSTLKNDFVLDFSNQAQRWLGTLNFSNTPLHGKIKRQKDKLLEQTLAEENRQTRALVEDWIENFKYFQNRLKVSLHNSLLSQSLEKLIEHKFFETIHQAKNKVDELVESASTQLKQIDEYASNEDQAQSEQVLRFHSQLSEFYTNQLKSEMISKYIRSSFRLLNREIALNLQKILPKEDRVLSIASDRTPADQVRQPQDVIIQKIDLYELYEQSILINFLPLVEEKLEGISNYIEYLFFELDQIFNQTIQLFDLDGETKEKDLSALLSKLQTQVPGQVSRIKELHHNLSQYIEKADIEANQLLSDCQKEVKEGLVRLSRTESTGRVSRRFEPFFNRIQSLGLATKSLLSRLPQLLKKLSLEEREREIDRTIRRKMQARTLDTTTIRQYITETYSLNKELEALPKVYHRLFSLEPIKDRRFFVAHKKKMEHFKPLIEGNGHRQQKMLIIGDRGMGKSSLLNVAQIEIKTDQLIRIDSLDTQSIIYSLGQQLNGSSSMGSLQAALRKKSTTVIIDNFDQLIDKKNLAETEMFLELVKQSSDNNHWILSMTKSNFQSLDRAFRIRSLFNKLIDLQDIPLTISRDILLSRHRLSGLGQTYPKGVLRDWIARVGISNSEDMFFRLLQQRSHGHLRHLIYLWLRSIQSVNNNEISFSPQNTLERGLPMIHDLSLIQKYILSETFANHQSNIYRLAEGLGASLSIIDNEVQYLENCGLMQSRGVDRTSFEIPLHLIYPVGVELKKEALK